jgi:hypothetical protein
MALRHAWPDSPPKVPLSRASRHPRCTRFTQQLRTDRRTNGGCRRAPPGESTGQGCGPLTGNAGAEARRFAHRRGGPIGLPPKEGTPLVGGPFVWGSVQGRARGQGFPQWMPRTAIAWNTTADPSGGRVSLTQRRGVRLAARPGASCQGPNPRKGFPLTGRRRFGSVAQCVGLD